MAMGGRGRHRREEGQDQLRGPVGPSLKKKTDSLPVVLAAGAEVLTPAATAAAVDVAVLASGASLLFLFSPLAP